MSRRKRLLVLGASRYCARSISVAREIGYEVFAVDRDPLAEAFACADHAEVVDIADAEGVLRLARRHSVHGVVPLNDFGVPTAAHVAAALGLVGISPAAAVRATRKTAMRAAWDEAGLPAVRWRSVSSLDEATEAARALACWPLVVKPSRGGGSRGVSIANHAAELPEAIRFAQAFSPDPELILEERLEGTEHSVETVTLDGETHVLAVSDKVKTPLPYRVDKSVDYPTCLSDEPLAALHDLVRRSVRAIGVDVGAAHVELCTTPEGPRLFEIGARCGGGGTPDPIVPYVTGVQMLSEVVRIHAGDPPHNLTPARARGCSYRFLTPAPGRLRRVTGLDDVAGWPGVLDCAATVREGDEIRFVRAGPDRAGFVIAGGETRDEAIALADRAEQHVRFEYA